MIELIVLPAFFAMLFQRSVLQQKCHSCYFSVLPQRKRRHTQAVQGFKIYSANNLPDHKRGTRFLFGKRQLIPVRVLSPDSFSNYNLHQRLFNNLNGFKRALLKCR